MTTYGTLNGTSERVEIIEYQHQPDEPAQIHVRRDDGTHLWTRAINVTAETHAQRVVREARELDALDGTGKIRAYLLANSKTYQDPEQVRHADKYGWYPSIFGWARGALANCATVIERQADELDAARKQIRRQADILARLDGTHLASCGHPANEDGECDCSSWPERTPSDA